MLIIEYIDAIEAVISVTFKTGRKSAKLVLKDEVPTLVIANSTNSRVSRHMYKRADIVMIVVGTNYVDVRLSSVGVRRKPRSYAASCEAP